MTVAFDMMNPVTAHPVSKLINFTRFMSIGDLQHMGPLGVLCWFLGSVLSELHREIFNGNAEERLAQMWESIVEEYEEQGTQNRLGMLTEAMFNHGSTDFSCFIGKAAETLSLLPVLHKVCISFHTGSPRDKHRLACFESLGNIFATCRLNGYRVPTDESDAMLRDCDRFMVHYNWLSQSNISRNVLRYNIVFKVHMLWHICYHAKFLNPKCTWCFEFEDFVGTMIISAKGCMVGSPFAIVG